MLAMWEDFVNTPSQARDREAAMRMAEKLTAVLEETGMTVTAHDVGPVNSCTLEAVWGADRPGQPVLFGGHYDTVNSSPVENPVPGADNEWDGTPHFRVDSQGKAYGLGCLDMKGGIVIAIYAVRAAVQAGLKRPIRLLLAGDEEINHLGSRCAEILTEEGTGALCAFNMETGLRSNQLAVFRKGGTRCRITVTGVEAHAGNDFTKGRSAIVEMAYKIVDIHNLTDLSVGTTMNIGTIQGGTIFNAVPAKCEIVVDMRFEKNEELEKAKKNLAAVCAKTYIEGTTTQMEYIDVMHVFETTEGGLRLLSFLQDTARETGLEAVDKIALGGSSDAAYLTMAGVPTVCSCGTMGEWNHTVREYAMVDSLYQRAKLFAGALLRMDQFAAQTAAPEQNQ